MTSPNDAALGGPAPAVLLTGMSATGKSTLLAELGRRGWDGVDTDEDAWAIEVRDAAGRVVDHVWDEVRIDRLLSARRHRPLAMVGTVSNQGRFYPQLSLVVLLTVSREVLLDRLATRTTNNFGKSEDERHAVLRDLERVEPLLRRGAHLVLDGTRPVSELADDVAALALGRRATPERSRCE